MRTQMTTITSVLPALLVLAMLSSTQAQTSDTASSRYRFVPTSKTMTAPIKQDQVRVASAMPAIDESTSPGQPIHEADHSEFHVPTGFEAAPRFADNSSEYCDTAPNANTAASTHSTPNAYAALGFNNENTPQFHGSPAQQIYLPPSATNFEDPTVPMNRNLFGIDRHCVCDEWDGFVTCGGLKANPGHYGHRFIVGCNPCEPSCGRCSKCLVDKHRSKKANACGCKSCKKAKSSGCTSCSGGCNECANASGAGSKSIAWKNANSPETQSPSAPTGGIFGKLKVR